jgi:hexosaminidase
MGAEGYVLEKDEVRDLFGYARELGFELIPEVQSLGHVQWITNAYPEIGEVDENEKQVEDDREDDLRPDKKFIHCYCPSNERSYEIIFDILDETIDVIKPQRYVHIGHDEVYHLGLCEKCRKTGRNG